MAKLILRDVKRVEIKEEQPRWRKPGKIEVRITITDEDAEHELLLEGTGIWKQWAAGSDYGTGEAR